ncbi:hypothetical protein [Nocardia veterana]|uniref:Lipoprotein n=1 Tax=Nocardia veterana TaxID=132249 RepID=A0A7X6RIG8_9NOCA|nr:hypothetical protein [Nocardia veterana]NKY87110.1 hypothetical protein [Nocardia veterana]
MRKILVAGLSSAVLALTLTACADDRTPTCCGPTSSAPGATMPTTSVPDDGSGLRRNTSPAPTPAPTSELRLPHITLPHITWPKREPGASGE